MPVRVKGILRRDWSHKGLRKLLGAVILSVTETRRGKVFPPSLRDVRP